MLFKKLFERFNPKTLEEHPEFTPLFNAIEEHVSKTGRYYDKSAFKDCEAYERLKNLQGEEKIAALLYLINKVNVLDNLTNNYSVEHRFYYLNNVLLQALMRTRIDFPEDFSFKNLFNALYPEKVSLHERPLSAFISYIEKHVKKYGLNTAMKADIQAVLDAPEVKKFIKKPNRSYYGADIGKAIKKLQNLLLSENEQGEKVIPPYQFGTGRFGSILSADLKSLPQQESWNALFHHLATANGSKPTQKFLTKAETLIQAIGNDSFKQQASHWLKAALQLPIDIISHTHTYRNTDYTSYSYEYIENNNFDLLKGFLWTMSRFADTHVLQIIAQLTEKCFQKVPSIGPVAAGVGNAGIFALASANGLEGISHLSRLKLKIKQNNTQKLIQQYIEEQAKKRGMKAAQIEECAVPDYGLLNGERVEQFDDYRVVLRLTDIGAAELQWFKPDGKAQKTVPAFIAQNADYNERYKNLKDIAKHIKQASSAQRERIDRLYLANLTWSYSDFANYYLNHGLVSLIARKLIWLLNNQPALFVEGEWQDEHGKPVPITEQSQVKLWHPIDSTAETVLAWRDRLEVLQLKQPFKQAYREIYLLTDAEINTRVYSNRMAAHILKQHQFNSLAAVRGWKYSLMGAYDDGRDNEVAKKTLPEYQLTAQFWIDQVVDTDSFNDVGIWNYVATDQVRFCDANDQAVPLIDVPPLVFSEIMRDVDLFVGVASVGNDPEWRDGGADGRQDYRDYWQRYSFGDLSEVAKTRKSVLERLLPRLKIRNVAHIDGKFLIVQGKRHQYKIHIGSGNILIAPNDRYLCIVPSRGKDKNVDNLFLPFEGDTGLSIVLSKAFLLAEDDKITDSTILSQLR